AQAVAEDDKPVVALGVGGGSGGGGGDSQRGGGRVAQESRHERTSLGRRSAAVGVSLRRFARDARCRCVSFSVEGAEAQGSGDRLQRVQGGGVVVAVDVDDDVAGALVRLQVLAEDVQPRFGHGAVQIGEDARLVAVDVQQAVGAGDFRQLHVRQVDAEVGVAAVQV